MVKKAWMNKGEKGIYIMVVLERKSYPNLNLDAKFWRE